jgi:hypothetical protein
MANLIGSSISKEIPGVSGENTAGGDGVRGTSNTGTGIIGTSENGVGVWGGSSTSSGVGGMSSTGYGVHGVSSSHHGVHGDSDKGTGVYGRSTALANQGQAGVVGEAFDAVGVFGKSQSSTGVGGLSNTGIGVHGVSENWMGVFGSSKSTNGGAGVMGEGDSGSGVIGKSVGGVGVWGISERGHAGFFEGDVHVTGDITLANADCAEHFDIADTILSEPGTVMVLGEEGLLYPSQQAYDKRVAGVVSGAGDYKPGIVLDKQQSVRNRQPIALLGKVYCKVDAQYGSIEIGDLLTTSPTLGHAMKASDQSKAFGTVIGKSLRALKDGQGLIPILIALQ